MELALDNPGRLRAVPEPKREQAPLEATDAELLVRVADRDRQRAEDAVQETFTAVWRSAASYRPERGPAAPWLYAVARNAVVDRMRARHEPPAEVPDLASSEPGP